MLRHSLPPYRQWFRFGALCPIALLLLTTQAAHAAPNFTSDGGIASAGAKPNYTIDGYGNANFVTIHGNISNAVVNADAANAIARSPAAMAADTVNVKTIGGAKGDLTVTRQNVYTTAGSRIVVLSNGGLTQSLIGRTIILANAGTPGPGSHLVTPISTVVDPSHATLASPAQATGTYSGQITVGYHAITSTFSFVAGSRSITASTSVFTPHMAGGVILLPGASIAPLVAKIVAVPDQSSLLLDTAAGTTDTNDGQDVPIGTDDSAAFAKAIAVAESRTTPALFVPDGYYLVLSSLDFTRWSGGRVSGTGTLYGAAADLPVVDLLSARFTSWQGVNIVGSPAAIPLAGISVGRISGASADNHRFGTFDLSGAFGLAALVDVGAETTSFAAVHFSNAVGPFAAVIDGIHHFAEQSAYVTQSQTIDTPNSFNEAGFNNCIFSTQSTSGAPVWVSNTAKMRLDNNSYLASASQQGVVVYGVPGSSVSFAVLDLHMEPTTLAYDFVFDGTASPQVTNLEWRDHNIQANSAAFHIDADAPFQSARLDDTTMVLGVNSDVTPTLVDNPANWTVSGSIHAPLSLFNLAAANWNGCFSDIYHSTTCAYKLRQIAAPLQSETQSRVLNSSDCGTVIRDTGTTAHTYTVPTGLETNCRIDLVQAGSGGSITLQGGTGMTAETVGSGTLTLSHQSTNAVGVGYVRIDSLSSFLFSTGG